MFTRKRTIAAAILAACLGLLLAVPSIVPLTHFIPELEAHLSGRLHEPVKVGSLRLVLVPLPHLDAHDVTVGKDALMHVDSLVLWPSLRSLLSDTRVISEISLDGVRVRQEFFHKAAHWTKQEAGNRSGSDTARAPSVRIERITISDADIRFRTFWLKGIDAQVELIDGRPSEIRLDQHGGRMRVMAHPAANGSWKLVIDAHDWKVPVGLPLQFDELHGKAIVTATTFRSDRMSGALYGGTVSGPVEVSWEAMWSVSGQLDIQRIDIAPVAALFNRNVEMSGRLTADPHISAQAPAVAELVSALEVDSDFAVESGAIQKVDVVAAAKNPFDKEAGKGGRTEFERLVGHVVLDRSGYRFSDLELSSGLLRATGDVTVARDQKLEGRIDAALKGTASLISMPLHVSGTVQEPSLFPTKTALAAAVAGSFLMPGIGTAAGIKVSQLTDKLFGPRTPRRKKEETAQSLPPVAKPGRQ